MLTTGSKWFFSLGLVSLVLAAAYGWSTGGNGLGPVTAGYKGGVGDHLGYTLLVSIGLTATFLGLVAVATRDAAPSALAQLAGTDVAPTLPAPAYRDFWPILGAFGAGLVALGLVISNVMFIVGFIVLLAVMVEWMVLAWSDRATGDPETNRAIRRRLLGPWEIPLAAFLLAAGAVVAFSRLLLTSSEVGAVGVATALSLLIIGVGALIATRPRLSANVVAGLLAVCAVGVVVAGVASAGRGERFIEHHQVEASDNGIQPYVPSGTEHASTTTTVGEAG